jgi:hypothetical protein
MFNLSWLAILYSQSNIIGLCIALAHVAVHLRIMGEGQREWVLLAGVFAFGLLVDQILFGTGVLNFAGKPGLAPLWLSCLWLVLATTLLHAFSFLQGRYILAMIFGAVGGTGSYIAGTKLTVVEFGSPLVAPATIALLWAMVFPMLLAIARLTPSLAEDDPC